MRRVELLAILLLVCTACSGGGEQFPEAGKADRVWAAAAWDTVVQIGRGPVDTTLTLPYAVELWRDYLIVTDDVDQTVKAYDRWTGSHVWTVGGKGEGPHEFEWIVEVTYAWNGNLLVVDAGNMRVVELSPTGEFVRVFRFQDLPMLPWSLLDLGDSLVVTMIRHPDGMAILTPDGKVRRLMSYPWLEPIPMPVSVASLLARDPGSDSVWVSAFVTGPGFMVWHRGVPVAHRYIDPLPFEPPVSRERIAAGKDRGWYTAVAVCVRGGEIFFLFGGRPRRRSDPEGAPTEIIDVYGTDGAYRRSYRLPLDAKDLSTDGEIFYVVQYEPYPSVLGLRPRPG